MKKILILFSIMALFLVGCGGPVSDSKLKDIYKELDALDFKTQENVANAEEVNADLAKIYIEPQLKVNKAFLDDMRKKDVKFILDKVEYKNIEIVKREDKTAILKVESVFSGNVVSIKDPKKVIEQVKDKSNKYAVAMEEKDGDWYISGVKY